MTTNVKPLKVSPTIKAARWAFLFFGIFYGGWKLNRLREYEKVASVIRNKKYKEKHDKDAAEARVFAIVEIKDAAEQCGVTDFPPGWSDNL